MSDLISHFHAGHGNFTIVPHHIFQIKYLKPDEKYLLIWFKSRPPTFQINMKGLAKNLGVGIDVIKRMSHNLQEHHHLIILRQRDGNAEWHFFEKPEHCKDFASPLKMPQVDFPLEDNVKKTKATASPLEVPHAEKPHEDNPPALVSIDPLVNIDQTKEISPSEDVQKVSSLDKHFKYLWEAWPNTKKKIGAIKAFKNVLSRKKFKSPDSIKSFVFDLKTDILERLRLTEGCFDDGFRETMFSTYLNNFGWEEALPSKPATMAKDDDVQKAIRDKANRAMADSRKRFKMDE